MKTGQSYVVRITEDYGPTLNPTAQWFDRKRNIQPIFEDVRHSGPSPPSLRTGLIYFVAAVISSAFVICWMLIIAADNGYILDQEICTCDCFDRRFKGVHFDETEMQYRHIYFNITSNTALLFVWSSLHLALLLAFVNRALASLSVSLGFRSGISSSHLRWRVLVCASVNFYGLVYGWWVMFNYINDARHWSNMGELWATQLFFSITDLVPAYMAYCLLATGSTPPNQFLKLALGISSAHILLALWDQGAAHILTRHPLAYRDMMFLASDVAGVLAVAPYTKLKSGSELKTIGRGVLLLSTFYLTLKSYVGSF